VILVIASILKLPEKLFKGIRSFNLEKDSLDEINSLSQVASVLQKGRNQLY